MISIMDIQNKSMDSEEAISIYRSCPYTQLSMASTCNGCQLNQGFVIENPEGEGGHIQTTLCRLIEVMEDTLAMMREDTGQK
jgi:hypothetical protein